MKKLKSLEFAEILSKDELKTTFGGVSQEIGGGACEPTGCKIDDDCPGSCKCREDVVHGNTCTITHNQF